MTDSQHCDLSKRYFEVISFVVRRGEIYRTDRQTHILSTADPITGLLLRAVRVQVAQGRNVLILESGAIKADVSRLTDAGKRALHSLTRLDYCRLMRNVDEMNGVDYESFKSHVVRSFP